MTITTHRHLAVLLLPHTVPGLLKTGHSVVTAMTGNAYFPSATPALTSATSLLTALDVAETATKSRAAGTVPARNAARAEVLVALQTLKGIVQAAADARPDLAETIITSAGMSVKKTPKRIKVTFVAKAGPISGSVHLVAKAAAPRASYDWAWSADGGKTWTQAPSTLQAKTTILGLPIATTCEFRYRVVTKAGEGDWSQVITFVVK